MKAIVWTRYGPPDVLELQQVERPQPKAGEILIRIRATTVTAGDCEMRALDMQFLLALAMRAWIGWLRPRLTTIPGTELAGEVQAVGEGVTGFKVGDKVFGSAGMSLGTNAEYICLPAESSGGGASLAAMPANMTFEQAATVPFGGRDALHFLRQAGLQSGERILINGAGGSIGTFAVQLAKRLGGDVTAVDRGDKLDLLRSLGSDHVIDYTEQDFADSGRTYHAIFDVVGTLSLPSIRRSIRPSGILLLANPQPAQMFGALRYRLTGGPNVVLSPASGTVADLVSLAELIEAGRLRTVIDRNFPLEDIVEAHQYVETGAKQGHVVITIDEE
ncbi:MAG: NAD(P)-dependent alcohol dehydrogenase [Anaerolineales bacterium]